MTRLYLGPRAAILIPFALLIWAQQDIAPVAAASISEAVLAEGPRGLSPEQFAKIQKRLAAFGKSGPLNQKLTLTLGATQGNEQLSIREVSFEREGFQHGFLQSLTPGDDRIILLFRTPEKSWIAFLTNSRFDLLSAATWDEGELPKPMAPDEAKNTFSNELIYWSVISDLF